MRLMSLLDQLRADDSGNRRNHERWTVLPELFTEHFPTYKHGKTVLIRGEVIVIGSIRNIGLPRHFYCVLHSESTAANPAGSGKYPHHQLLDPQVRPPRARPVAMGVNRYKAESETNYYTDPWTGWLMPEPTALVAWISNILATTRQDTPQLEKMFSAKR
jgi:hypothetical protein